MLNRRTVWTLAVAEMRSCRRLVRTWVFVVVALLFCIGWYGDAIDLRWPSPPGSFGVNDVTARYRIADLVNGFVAIFSVGIIFLAFDIRGRDVHNRISDVIDSLPASNLELLVGRLAGIYLLLFVPCFVFLALLTGYESISGLFESRFRLGIQPLSVISLVMWNLIPSVLFYGALVVCLSVLVRLRFLAAILAIGVLIGFFWINNFIPVRLQESFAQFLGSTIVPSDLAPSFVSPAILVNRCGLMFVSIALILFSASALHRIYPRRILNSTLGVVAVSVATIVYFSLFAVIHYTENQKDEWVKTHEQQKPESFPNVHHLQGTVELRPGNNISLDITLTVTKPASNTTDSVVFSLNPGYKIQKLWINGDETTNYRFSKHGLLSIPSDLLSNTTFELRLQAKGKPNDRFAYLDQARDYQKLSHKSIRRLGLRNSIFSRDFVALMPGVFWYPTSGSAVGRDQIESTPVDVFTTDLKVIVPRDWQVATVGERIEEDPQRSAIRFKCSNPVPEFALFAANFDRRKTDIEGIGLEVLFSKNHLNNLNALVLIEDELQEWVAELIKRARSASLDYPYNTFYIVEVPSNLRTYGGGWRMDTVLQPPGMMLIRESSFPTEEFREIIGQPRNWGSFSEEQIREYVFDSLLKYFRDDLQGGSPFAGIARNFFSHQLSTTGQGATVLRYLLNQLSNQIITQTESASIISMAEYATSIPWIGIEGIAYTGVDSRATNVRKRIAKLPTTWELMDRVALHDLDFKTNPISSYRVLLTKGHALAELLILQFGPEQIGAFLKQLLTNFREQSMTVEDFFEVASEMGLEFEEWMLPWLTDTVLPGYRVEPAAVSKIDATELNENEYQTTFVLHNAEPIPGLVGVLWSDKEEPAERWSWGSPGNEVTSSDPVYVPGYESKQISIRSTRPLRSIWIEPFLAQNRAQFNVPIQEFDENALPESPPLPFVANIDWQPRETGSIIVDDLDPNFAIVTWKDDSKTYTVVNTDSSSSLSPDEFDQGLRIDSFPGDPEWTRLYDSSSYGHYRRSYARIARGDQTSAARFVANLSRIGQWRLEIYLPEPVFEEVGYYFSSSVLVFGINIRLQHRLPALNSPNEHYTILIRYGNSDRTEKFDIANAKVGWNEVGLFEMDATEVEVLLSDWAGHQDIMVFADAIRWTPVSDTSENSESSL